eukprot:CAMPEP_0184866784 /NCGR_PEP_ID=MMETSP0580-20130426/23703_1 /TAXON_ID=1118495 /ORGANISM="Dactyliosolen fragilissimus" /LENGTH=265 /DNA_ID=CAMNT_0027366649 /DNA_START=228 /DNA_END=1025 /DNA_ORIENTATION=+
MTTKNVIDSRPVMHTFYQSTPGGQELTLQYWKESWELAGFQTRILDISDFEKHPDSEQLKRDVISRVGESDKYNQYCFYRWFAMSSIPGGGWMSDYDTFPANFPMEYSNVDNLPYGGKFSTFEAHIPSLMAGSSQEWERLAHLVLKATEEISPHDPKTDMYAFQEVLRHVGNRQKENGIFYKNNDVKIKQGLYYLQPHLVDCKEMDGVWAIHLSHMSSAQSSRKGLWPVDINPNDAHLERGIAARIYFSEWRDQCGTSAPFPLEI